MPFCALIMMDLSLPCRHQSAFTGKPEVFTKLTIKRLKETTHFILKY